MISLRSAAGAAFVVTVLVTSRAQAEPPYPGDIERTWSLNYTPPCSICHQYGKTGDGTPIEPFAYSMRARGLTGDHATLEPALAAAKSSQVDSDGDGISDYTELTNGTDPNSAGNDCLIPSGTTLTSGQCTPGSQSSPSLGCGGSPSTGGGGGQRQASTGVATLLAVAFCARARRRRGKPRAPRTR